MPPHCVLWQESSDPQFPSSEAMFFLIFCALSNLLPLFLIIGRLTFFTPSLTIHLIQKFVQNVNYFVVAYFINTSSSIMS